MTSAPGSRPSIATPSVGRGRGFVATGYWRPIDDPNYVMIDLEFDTAEQARALLEAMRAVWAGPARAIISDPQARIAEQLEERVY